MSLEPSPFSTSALVGPGRSRTASVVVIVGNPRPQSRTRAAAELVGQQLAWLTSAPEQVLVIDLADVGGRLLDWSDHTVAELKALVLGAQALVVACPTYKASFTGLLKLFLDRFAQNELSGMPTVALMTGDTPEHAMVVDTQLRPVLVELGASLPTRGIFLTGPAVDDATTAVSDWYDGARRSLERIIWQ